MVRQRFWSIGCLVFLMAAGLQTSVAASAEATLHVTQAHSGSVRLAQMRSPFSIEQVEIGQINSGSTEAQVRQVLGNPARVEDEYWDCCGNMRMLSYGSTSVKLMEDDRSNSFIVFAFSTTDPNLTTRDGIRIGSTLSDVSVAYGNMENTEQDGDGMTVFYSVDEYATSMIFRFQKERVIEMSFLKEIT